MWSRVQVRTPGALPLTGAELRARLRIDDALEEDLLESYLQTAAAMIEGPKGKGLALLDQTWTATLDRWTDAINLPGWPVTGAAEIRYKDSVGANQVLDVPSHFHLDLAKDPARLVRRMDAALPALWNAPSAVSIDYTLGRAGPDEVDPGLVTALALLAGHFYEHREASTAMKLEALPFGVSHLLGRFTRGMMA